MSKPIAEDLKIQCQQCFSMTPMAFEETIDLGDGLVEDCYWCENCGAEHQVQREDGGDA